MQRPIEHCYWVVPGKLLAGEYPRRKHEGESSLKVAALLDAGVNAFIDLTEEGELSPYCQWIGSASHERFPVHDMSIPDSPALTASILNAIDDHLAHGDLVYLHCWGGVGRTGTIVGCWLARRLGDGEEALIRLRELWKQNPKSRARCVPDTSTQCQYIRDWVETMGNSAQAPADHKAMTRYEGCLLGLAAADAVGTALEFKAPGSFAPITDMVGGGPFGLKPGEWTDDTSMALCLAQSLTKCGRFDAKDQMQRYVRWRNDGYMSSNGRCFDIGRTVSSALHKFQATGAPYAGSSDPNRAGNGSLMRLAPVPMFFAQDPEAAVFYSGLSSMTTHGAKTCIAACRYYGALIVGALQGVSKDALLAPHYAPVEGLWERLPLCPEIDAIADGSFKIKDPPAVRGTGYVVQALEAALWAFDRSSDFGEGCLLAANLGDDADTTAAIYGQLAGAYYGVESIPVHWREQLAHLDLITDLAHRMCPMTE